MFVVPNTVEPAPGVLVKENSNAPPASLVGFTMRMVGTVVVQ